MPKFILLIFFAFLTFSIYSQDTCDTTLFEKGKRSFNKGNFDSAIILYTQLILKCPTFTSAYLNRGMAYYNLARQEEAEQDFKQSINVAKHKSKVSLYIGNILFEAEDYMYAKEYFSITSQIDKSESEAYFKQGRCLWLNRINILKENNVQDYAQDTALKSHLKDEIIGFYSKAIYWDSVKNYSYYKSDKRDAIADTNTNYEYYYDRAIVRLNFGEYRDALIDFESSIELHPTIDAYYYSAYVAKAVGEKQKACNYIQMWATMFNPSEKMDVFKKHEIADKFCSDLGINKK